jgi:hypothetical protein
MKVLAILIGLFLAVAFVTWAMVTVHSAFGFAAACLACLVANLALNAVSHLLGGGA